MFAATPAYMIHHIIIISHTTTPKCKASVWCRWFDLYDHQTQIIIISILDKQKCKAFAATPSAYMIKVIITNSLPQQTPKCKASFRFRWTKVYMITQIIIISILDKQSAKHVCCHSCLYDPPYHNHRPHNNNKVQSIFLLPLIRPIWSTYI